MWDFLLALIFPKRCVSCNRLKCGYLCGYCFSRVSFHESGLCAVCLKPSFLGYTHQRCLTKFDIVGYAAGVEYGPVVRKLVHKFKYKPYLSDLKTEIGRLFCESLEQNELFFQIKAKQPLLLPIPLSQKRLRMRGYNQAGLLTSYVAQYFKLKQNSEILFRTRDTKAQFLLTKPERFANIKNAFSVSSDKKQFIQGKTIILIDDIATTCSTLREAAKILRKNGAGEVYGVTFAKEL